jgi:type I restriction enzyme, S subunit
VTAHVRSGSSRPKSHNRVSSVPPAIEQAVSERTLCVEEFVESFEVLVEAAGGTAQLDQLVLGLAIRGKLFSSPIAQRDEDQNHPSESEEAFSLPSDWKWLELGEVCADSFYGPRFAKGEYALAGGIPTIRTTDMTQDGRIVLRDPPRVKVEPGKLDLYRVKDGDLLVTRTGSIGTMAVFRGTDEAIPSAYLIRFRFTPAVLAEYVYIFLKSPFGQNLLGLGTTRVAQPNVNATAIRAIRLPLPPLAEQKRIVARVDQLMALIDDLEQKQIRERQLGANFTKASLEALTTAETPEDFDGAWKRVVENWTDLFRPADSVSELRTLCLWLALSGKIGCTMAERQAWVDTTLGSISSFVTSGSRGWKEFYANTGAIFIRSQDIKTDAVDLSTPAYVALPDRVEGSRTRVQKDDLLVTITGANVGKAAHVTIDLNEAYVSQHVALIRLQNPQMAPWVHKWLVSPKNGRATLTSFSYGDKPGLNLDNVKSVPIAVPPLPQQKRIVAIVDYFMKLCDELEAKLCRSEDRASKLIEAVVQEMVG